MRFFNTAGPVRRDDHYAIPSLDRMDMEDLLGLIRAKHYFVLHAPRQTGKTSALIALRDLLNSGEAGDFRCVHTNVEVGQVARDDVARGMRAILSRLAMRARLLGDGFPHESWRTVLEASGPDDALGDLLSNWVPGGPDAAGAAGGRDRLPGRRHPALGAAPASCRLRAAPRSLPAKRRAVRGGRSEARRRSEDTEERGSEADGSERRQEGRKVAVWTL